MKTIRSACTLQPNALEINIGDQIEKLDEIISNTDGKEYYNKTFIIECMKTMLPRGMARLAGKSNDSIFHLKQAMGGGKTHLMVGFGLLVKDATLRSALIGEIARQLDKEALLKTCRALLIISADGKTPPEVVKKFFASLINKNNLLVLTGDKSSIASLDKDAQNFFSVKYRN